MLELQITNSQKAIKFEKAILRFRLNAPPRLSISVPDEDRSELAFLAASRVRGRVHLSADVVQPMEIDGVSTIADAQAENQSAPARWLQGSIAPPDLLDWLDRKEANARPDELLVLQRGRQQGVSDFLRKIVDKESASSEEGEDWLVSDRSENRLSAISPGACLLRPGWATNREFLSIATAELSYRDPRLLGWRITPYDRGGIVFVVAMEAAVVMDQELWALPGVFQRGSPLRLRRHGAAGERVSIGEIESELFGAVHPRDELFNTQEAIPATPRLVSIFGRIWLAAELSLHITEEGISEIWTTLVEPPTPGPLAWKTQLSPSLVQGWTNDGQALVVTPSDSSWRVLTGDPEAPKGALLAQCLTPASKEDGEGVYLRPTPNAPRLVRIASGARPIAVGSLMIRNDALEGEDVDIGLSGSGLAFSTSSAKISLAENMASVKANDVEIEGIVMVNGSLDVSS